MVGKVLDALDRNNLAANTLVMASSDNGALPGCLGRTYGHRSNGDLRGYKGYIWDGGHREPFIARWPGRIAPDSKSGQLSGLQDLMATVAAIVGEDLPYGAAEDSVSFLPALLGDAPDRNMRKELIHHSCLGVFSIRRGDWKLIAECDNSGDMGRGVHGGTGSGPIAGSKGQLYNLEDDPLEVYNLFDGKPDIVRELIDLLEGCRRERSGTSGHAGT
jgi:arylsulfatase A-like enzyme